MSLKSTLFAAAAVVLASTAAMADGIAVKDAYARSSNALAGAAFMAVENSSTTDDRLIGVRSDVAQRIELHTHLEDANGVMRMIKVEDGIPVPAGGMAMLQRGGDHVMLMGLTRELNHGDTVDLTLIFEHAGEVEVTLPVDLERKPAAHGAGHNHDHSGS